MFQTDDNLAVFHMQYLGWRKIAMLWMGRQKIAPGVPQAPMQAPF